MARLAVLATAGKGHPRVLLGIYIPLVVLAALGAALFMDNIAHVRNEKRALRDASRDPQTWIIAFLYIGTFGSFTGFSFAFDQVLQDQFAAHFPTAGKADPVKIAYLTLGPLLGSLSRTLGGRLADRIGGARATFWSFALMTLAASVVLAASLNNSLPLFCVGFIALFVLPGRTRTPPGTMRAGWRARSSVSQVRSGRLAVCWSTSRSGSRSWPPGPATLPTSGSSRST